MSKFTFEDLQQVVDLNPFLYQEASVCFYGLVTEEDVQNAEKQLGVTLPEPYRKVVLTWGQLFGGGTSVFLSIPPKQSVIDSLDSSDNMGWEYNTVTLTKLLREETPETPLCYIEVGDIDDDWCECMDTSTPEGVIVDWNYIGGYVEGTVADSFIDYVFEDYMTWYRDLEEDYETTFKWPKKIREKLLKEFLELGKEISNVSLPEEWY